MTCSIYLEMGSEYREFCQSVLQIGIPKKTNFGTLVSKRGSCSVGIYLLQHGEEKFAVKLVRSQDSFTACLEREYMFTLHTSHPNIRSARQRPLYGPRFSLLALEYVPGAELYKLIKNDPDIESIPLPSNAVQWRKALARRYIAICLTQGLMHLHKLGIVHNDIKPENVLVEANSMEEVIPGVTGVKWCDFGFAFQNGDANVLRGSDSYLCPEKSAHILPLTSATDIFSFGLLFFGLCCGRMAVESRPRAEDRRRPQNFKMLKRLLKKFDKPYGGLFFYKEPRQFFVAAAQLDIDRRASAEDLLKLPFVLEETLSEGSPYVSRHKLMRRFTSEL